jgi:hypothetical protein
MLYCVDRNNKVIYAWSAKCGCSHIKNIYWFYMGKDINKIENIHLDTDQYLPRDIQNYTTIIVCRNPYKRVVSGFIDKIGYNEELRHKFQTQTEIQTNKILPLVFSCFVDELIQNNWKRIDDHHFTPQTSEKFNKILFSSKDIKIYDICNIDYEYIENLYNKKIPDYVMNSGRNSNNDRTTSDKSINKDVYDLNIDEYKDYKVDIKFFYNEEIKNKIYNYYLNDFIFFKEHCINYTGLDTIEFIS